MQITGRVEKVTDSKSGKAKRILIDGKWIGADFDCGIRAGDAVTIIYENGKYGDWCSNWQPATVHQGQPPAPRPPESPTTASDVHATVAPWFMPFVSNQCAHAILAGLIKEPKDLTLWAQWAKDAACEL